MNEKYFLVFWIGDGGDRESNSVYYSCLVKANSKTEAIERYINSPKCPWSSKETKYFDGLEVNDKNYLG